MAERANEGDLTYEQRKERFLSVSTISGEEYDRIRKAQDERQARVPQPGTKAPDFEVERLGEDGARTGKTVRLSDLCGKPVALVFGSYT